MLPFFFLSNHRGSHIPSAWMVHAGCVFVADIHLFKTWLSGSLESERWIVCEHRMDLGLFSHPTEFVRNGVRIHANSNEKNPVYQRLRGGWNLPCCIRQDSQPNTLPAELLGPTCSF